MHIHHLVFGIVAMMVAGFLQFATQPGDPWLEILAAIFGIGMGLTLDEFALWLYLEDVYWSDEGRSSVDAVIFAAIIGGGTDRRASFRSTPATAVRRSRSSAPSLVTLGICAIVALKGKISSAIIGMIITPVAWVGGDSTGAPWVMVGEAPLQARQREAGQGAGAKGASTIAASASGRT